MLDAIFAKRTWRKANTSVVYVKTADIVCVYLHDNLIALIFPTTRQVMLSSAGWRTVTTKSRLNAILETFYRDAIHQRHGVWYYNNSGEEFIDEPLETILRNEIDARIEMRHQANDRNLFSA